jgi:hypothetical protein
MNGLHEIRRDGGFAVSAERHVAKSEQVIGHVAISRQIAELTGMHPRQRRFELRCHDIDVQCGFAHGRAAIHFAIRAIKIAAPVRIHIHTDG